MKEQHVIETAREADASIALVVTGMHRSGTSAVTKVMSLLGAALPRHLMTPQADNPKGFWESDLVVALNDELLANLGSSWDDALSLLLRRDALSSDEKALQRMRGVLAMDFGGASPVVMKDPRVSVLLDPWIAALQRSHYAPRVVVVVRDPLEIAASLAARNGFSVGRSLLLWLTYFLAAERSSRGVPRVFIHYDDVLNDWRAVMRRVQSTIDAPFSRWSPAVELEVDAFLSASDRHHRVPAGLIGQRSDVADWVKRAYAWSLEAARGATTPDPATLDEIATNYTASLSVFAPLIAEHQGAMRTMRAQSEELRHKLAAEEHGNADRTAHIGHLERLISEADGHRAEAEARFQTALNDQLLQRSSLEAELEGVRERVAALDATLFSQSETARNREAALTAQVQMRDARIGSLEAGVHKERGRVSALEAQLRIREAESQARVDAHEVERQTREAEFRAALDAQLQAHEVELHALSEDARASLLKKQTELEAVEAQLAGHAAALEHERSVSEQLRSDIDARDTATRAMLDTTHRAYQSSTSWRVTAPIRWFGAIGRKVRLLGANVSTITQQVGGLSKTVERAHQIVKQEGISGLTRRVENVVNRAAAVEADPANTQLSILERNRPLEVIASEWKTQGEGWTELSREQLVRHIAAVTKDTVYLSLTHDNYSKNFGGIQLCAQIEEAQARTNRQAYVNLHPVQPLPILAPGQDGFRFAVVLNGAAIGASTVANVLGAIADLRADKRTVTMIVHSLLGHAPEVATQLAQACGDQPAYFWLHDYLSVCPSYNLLRNNLTFCGAPAPRSNACAVCLHGEHRQAHIDRIKRFITSANVMLLSPSDYALRLWRKALDLNVKAAIVPHVAFAAQVANGRAVDAGEPIRIAYLGLPSHHKGWSAFARLVGEFGADPGYRFYHFGQMNSGLANVKFVPVKVSADDRAAMTNAIAQNQIDVAFIWSMWPETFCFTMYEALAGGASILTNPNSGNVQDTVRMSGEGVVIEDEPSLIQFVSSGDLRERIRAQRTHGRKQRSLLYSDMSFAPQAKEPMA